MKKLFMILTLCLVMMFAGQSFAEVNQVGFSNDFSGANADASVSGVTASSGINEAGTIKDSFNSGPGKRGLYIMNQATFIPPASYFGPNENGHQFFPLKTLLHFKDTWTVDEAQNMLSEKKGGKDVEIRPAILPEKGAELPTEVKCVLEDPEVFAVVGFGAIAASDDGSITPDVFAKAIVEAAKLNANTIQFLAEGKNVKLLATGWGININGGISAIGGDDSSSSATGGGGFAGTGYSSYESGYANMPWLQMVFLRVEKKTEVVAPKAITPLNENIMFDYDSDKIRSDQEVNLDNVAKFVKENPETLVVIKGYASEEGPEAYNTVLSARRATAVEWALMDRGVEKSNIKSVKGEGETVMFGDELSANRRVIVISISE